MRRVERPEKDKAEIVTRVDANEEIYKKILDDEDFATTVKEFYLHKVYERLREGRDPDETPSSEVHRRRLMRAAGGKT